MSATITVKTSKGEEKKVKLSLTDTIGKAKEMSGEKGATWKFGGSLLEDNKKVMDYFLETGDVIDSTKGSG